MLQMLQGWDALYGNREPGWDKPTQIYYPISLTRTGQGYSNQIQYEQGNERWIMAPPRATAVIGSAVMIPRPSDSATPPGYYYYNLLALEAQGGQYGYQGIELIMAGGPENRLHVRTSQPGGPDASSGYSWPTDFVMPYDTWIYLELKGRFSTGNTGMFEARANGATILKKENLRTQNAPGADELITHAMYGTCGIPTLHDDSYALDTTGSTLNDFLGDVRVAALRPSAPGDATEWSTTTGPNWDAANGDQGIYIGPGTQVSTTTPGATDLYNVPDLSGNIEVLAVQTVSTVYGTASVLTKAAGATNIGSRVGPGSGAHLVASEVQPLDPAGNAWTKTTVGAMQVGVKNA